MAAKQRTVLITGANGYIGSAACRAFVRAGWRTFGLIRRPEAAQELQLIEAIPVVGTFSDTSFLLALLEQAPAFHAIVSCTEQLPGYAAHFEEVLALVRKLAERSNGNGVKPLVLWSSGCKDYGMTPLHGSPGLSLHTEDSPLNPPGPVKERTESCVRLFDYASEFDAVVLRPTSVFGYASSYYGSMFDYAAAEASSGESVLRIPGDPNVIMHATHVDDCAEAYVALVEHAERSTVVGQAFNISGHRYETAGEVAEALAKEYGFSDVEFVPAEETPPSFPSGLHLVFSFSQWVASEKIRRVTGWRDRRGLFSENLGMHRRVYEVYKEMAHGNIAAVKERLEGLASVGKEIGASTV